MKISIRIPKGLEKDFNKLSVEVHNKMKADLSDALGELIAKQKK